MAVANPYTHAMHAHRCVHAAHQGVVLAQQRVQVRKRGVIYCARIQHAYTTPDGQDCWTVDAEIPERCRFTVSVRNVRLCGQSDCFCDSKGLPAEGAPLRGEGAVSPAGGVTCK